jgi:hypothetical protein
MILKLEMIYDDMTFDEIDRRTNVILDLAKRFTPVVTGRLRAGWKKHIKPKCPWGNSQGRIIIENKVPYASYVEYGTRLTKGPPAAMLRKALFYAEMR